MAYVNDRIRNESSEKILNSKILCGILSNDFIPDSM